MEEDLKVFDDTQDEDVEVKEPEESEIDEEAEQEEGEPEKDAKPKQTPEENAKFVIRLNESLTRLFFNSQNYLRIS